MIKDLFMKNNVEKRGTSLFVLEKKINNKSMISSIIHRLHQVLWVHISTEKNVWFFTKKNINSHGTITLSHGSGLHSSFYPMESFKKMCLMEWDRVGLSNPIQSSGLPPAEYLKLRHDGSSDNYVNVEYSYRIHYVITSYNKSIWNLWLVTTE